MLRERERRKLFNNKQRVAAACNLALHGPESIFMNSNAEGSETQFMEFNFRSACEGDNE